MRTYLLYETEVSWKTAGIDPDFSGPWSLGNIGKKGGKYKVKIQYWVQNYLEQEKS